MYIDSLKIENYKCFHEQQEITLSPGFNLFIGKNNSGKTSALELLNKLDNVSEPHKSKLSVNFFGETTKGESQHSIRIVTKTEELNRIFGKTITIPLPKEILDKGNIAIFSKEIGEKIIASEKIILDYTFLKQKKNNKYNYEFRGVRIFNGTGNPSWNSN